MTDPADNLDANLLPPVDSQVPDSRDNLPDDFWIRPVAVVPVAQGRL